MPSCGRSAEAGNGAGPAVCPPGPVRDQLVILAAQASSSGSVEMSRYFLRIWV